MADSGILLIAFAGWEALTASPQTLLYSCGATLCFAGLALIWIGTTNLGHLRLPRRDDAQFGLNGTTDINVTNFRSFLLQNISTGSRSNYTSLGHSCSFVDLFMRSGYGQLGDIKPMEDAGAAGRCFIAKSKREAIEAQTQAHARRG